MKFPDSRQVGESYKDYATRMAGDARAAEIDRDKLAAEVERLSAVERNVKALMTHCDQIDAAGYAPIEPTFGTAAIRGFLDGHHVANPHDDL